MSADNNVSDRIRTASAGAIISDEATTYVNAAPPDSRNPGLEKASKDANKQIARAVSALSRDPLVGGDALRELIAKIDRLLPWPDIPSTDAGRVLSGCRVALESQAATIAQQDDEIARRAQIMCDQTITIATLRDERDHAYAQGQRDSKAEIERYRDIIATLRRDAERYRWLRVNGYEHCDNELPYIAVHGQNSWGQWKDTVIEADKLDAAIDAALATEEPKACS